MIVGVLTLVLIVVLTRTRLGALGLVVAVVLGSAVAALFELFDHPVATVGDVTTVPHGLPLITAPVVGDVPGLLVPAVALAFVGMVQGAAVSAAYPNTDGSSSDASRDFVAQGSGSILSGLFQGMPAGGSMSATALVVQAGSADPAVTVHRRRRDGRHRRRGRRRCRTRRLPCPGGVADRRRRRHDPARRRSGPWSRPVRCRPAVLAVTFGLTVLIPVQQAVLAGVALAVVLFVISQSNRVVVKRARPRRGGAHPRERPASDGRHPARSSCSNPSAACSSPAPPPLPAAARRDHRHRARRGDPSHAGHRRPRRQHRQRDRRSTPPSLAAADSRLLLNGGEQLLQQLTKNGVLVKLGPDCFYLNDAWHGRTLRRADADARQWITDRTGQGGDATDPGA